MLFAPVRSFNLNRNTFGNFGYSFNYVFIQCCIQERKVCLLYSFLRVTLQANFENVLPTLTYIGFFPFAGCWIDGEMLGDFDPGFTATSARPSFNAFANSFVAASFCR